jgi:hypothetical protein
MRAIRLPNGHTLFTEGVDYGGKDIDPEDAARAIGGRPTRNPTPEITGSLVDASMRSQPQQRVGDSNPDWSNKNAPVDKSDEGGDFSRPGVTMMTGTINEAAQRGMDLQKAGGLAALAGLEARRAESTHAAHEVQRTPEEEAQDIAMKSRAAGEGHPSVIIERMTQAAVGRELDQLQRDIDEANRAIAGMPPAQQPAARKSLAEEANAARAGIYARHKLLGGAQGFNAIEGPQNPYYPNYTNVYPQQ